MNMKSWKIKRWLLLLSLSLFLVGCGKKEIVGTNKIATQSRIVSVFSSLSISGYYNIHITIGNPQAVAIKVSSNLLPYIESTVKGKTLTVQTKKGYLLRPQGIPEVDIVVPKLNKITLSGNNHATVKAYSGDSLELNLAGYNEFEIQGVVNTLDLEISGSSSINAQNLLANKVEVNAVGNSKIYVNAKNSLKVTISGNGIVNFVGNPKVSQTINGSGTISKMPETINK
jgi:hypothetical protein